MSQNVESEISKIDDFLKQLGGGGGQASSSSSSKGIVSKFRECFVRRVPFSTASTSTVWTCAVILEYILIRK